MGVAKLTDLNTIVPDAGKYALLERERRYLLQDLPEGFQPTDDTVGWPTETGGRVAKGCPPGTFIHWRTA